MNLTASQLNAVAARGNVIVVAGAGTGKTSTLVARCLDVVRQGTSLDRILMVTFTEAAAAEMRHRLRLALQHLVAETTDGAQIERWSEQLALAETAKISTIHSFCLRLVQAHFHELGLDPEVKVLDDPQCRTLRMDTLDALMEECYGGALSIGGAVRSLITAYAPDRDTLVRELVLKLHDYTQSLPNASDWIQQQKAVWATDSPAAWNDWLVQAFIDWRQQWLPVIKEQAGVQNIDDCLTALNSVPANISRGEVEQVARAVVEAGSAKWPKGAAGRVRNPLKKFFEEAGFLASVSTPEALEADWNSVRHPMGALLQLTLEFSTQFTHAKRDLGGVDFPDLEQLTLRLLRDDSGQPTPVAREWQKRLDYVFVDECQDINGAQDAILTAVSRGGTEANRFLVGDVKQSIYQFRLADPEIFRRYEEDWNREKKGLCISLTENFRSRPGVLSFVNALFSGIMREGFGSVTYEPLQAGDESPWDELGDGPCVELHLIRKEPEMDFGSTEDGETELADLSAAEREARLVALRLVELKASKFKIWDKDKKCRREVEWRDMAVLMRSPGPRTEAYAKVFHEAKVPLAAPRGGFLQAIEVSDLVSLLQLLDNPMQDIPLLAVLRSPMVGLTLDELATIRAENAVKPFWSALRRFATGSNGTAIGGDVCHGVPDQNKTENREAVGRIPAEPLRARIAAFLAQFERWRDLARQVGPSLCLEQVLTDTNYDVLLRAHQRGVEQAANVRRLMELARQFDPYLRQGLYRFLKFLKALEAADESLEPAPVSSSEAVRLLSVHKSKGLEFPVVVLAGLGSKFNLQELNGLVLLDSQFGLAPKAITDSGTGRYPTLPFWLAERHQRAQRLSEELRLLYVATTRARDRLICAGTLPRKDQGRWESRLNVSVSDRELLSAQCPLDWLYAWLPTLTPEDQWDDDSSGHSGLMTWKLWDPQDAKLRSPIDNAVVPDRTVPVTAVDPEVAALVAARMSWAYEFGPATTEPAKSSVSVLRRRATELVDEDAANRFPKPQSGSRRAAQEKGISAAQRGTLHHRFLEHLDLDKAEDAKALMTQAEALVQRGVFSEVEASTLDLARISTFWASPVGRQIRARLVNVRRELPFTARFALAEVQAALGQTPINLSSEEFVVVQGVVDLAVLLDKEIWVLDFKTDSVFGEVLRLRANGYAPQLRLYAMALEAIYQKPVRHQWLHFLNAGETVELEQKVVTG